MGDYDVTTLGPRVTTGENGLPVVRLADGRVARFARRPKGKDAELAFDAAGKKGNNFRVTAALLSRVLVVDEKQLNTEEMLELDLADINLLGEKLAENF